LRAIFYQPTLSYQLNEKLGIGLGFVFATGKFEMNKALPVYGLDGEGSVNLEGSTSSLGFNAGFLFKPIKRLNIGVDYRSSVNMEIDDATATFNVPISLQSNFPNTIVSTKLPLPANLDLGVSYDLNKEWLVAFNLNYVFWSSYDSLIFDFAENTPALADSRNPREYSDKMIIRLGAQYTANEKYQFRFGGYFDPSPVNSNYFSPETPSLNSIGLTAGLTYCPIKNLALDLSFLFISGQKGERSYLPDNFSGTYKTYSYIPGIGLTFNF
jgi:long-chain fatty acid transport protein